MHEESAFLIIVGFVADLMFQVRIEEAAKGLGFRLVWVENVAQIAPDEPEYSGQQYAEHLEGPGAILIDRLTTWKPALVVFDLGNSQVPWRKWLPLIKSAPATRRIPVLCYGSHVGVEAIQDAREAGANAVVARSHFARKLHELIQEHASILDIGALLETCKLPLSPLAIHGLELMNQGEYFEAHELLEEAWNQDQTPGRELYRAILQVAVAYLQIERGNYNGAVKMFLRLRQWIDPLPASCRGVDVTRLRRDVRTVHEALLSLGRERIAEFDHSLFRPVVYQLN